MKPPEQLLCQSWFRSRDLQHGQNCSLLCCVFTLGYDVDETTLSWKSFLLVSHKALPLVTSAVVSASHSKHTEPRSEMLSQPSDCCWMMLWTWDFPWTGFAGVRQLNPEPEQVYISLATCFASRHSWSSPHLLTLTWPCSLVEACWAQQNWCGWPERVIPSCPFPQKVRRGKGINSPKCLLSHGNAHTWCAVPRDRAMIWGDLRAVGSLPTTKSCWLPFTFHRRHSQIYKWP